MKKFLLSLMMISSFSAFSEVNVNKVNELILKSKANWKARETWVSKLSKSELKNLFGNNELPQGKVDYSNAFKGNTYEAVDWRNDGGINWLGPVMNQGNCGSCVAFATIATIEAQMSISTKAAWLHPEMSPQALFSCGGGQCARGWFPSSAATYVKANGIVDNACSPYISGSTGQDVQCKQFCNNQSARTYKIAGFTKPTTFGGGVEAVKAALKKGPLVTTMTVYEDFLTYSSGIYRSVSSTSVGGHAVSLVGFNDQGRYWIVRNSWGADWGENGFVRISWDDKSGIGSSTIAFNILPESNTLSILSPVENDYVSNLINVSVGTTKADDVKIKLMKNGVEVSAINCAKFSATTCQSEINTETLEDGKYELIAFSSTNPSVKSLVRGFTIVNREPSMNIKFQAIGADLTKPVVGRLEFKIDTESTPVSMQKLDFIVQKLDGTLVAKRTTEVVLNSMKLGFRFNSLPNGDYEIFYRGSIPVNGKQYQVDSNHFKIKTKN